MKGEGILTFCDDEGTDIIPTGDVCLQGVLSSVEEAYWKAYNEGLNLHISCKTCPILGESEQN